MPGPVLEALAKAAGRSKRLRFDEFQRLVLYDPDVGYFSTSHARAGRAGDFVTSPEISPLFSQVVAKVLVQDAARLGADEFHLVEVGAGRGTLARSIHDALRFHPLQGKIRFHLVEAGKAARAACAAAMDGVPASRWKVYENEEELPRTPWTAGGVLANELFDNLPVRRVMQGRSLQEIVVHVRKDGLHEELVPAPVEVTAYLEAQGIRLASGQTAEVCLEAPTLLARLLRHFGRSSLLVFDYGDAAKPLYDAERFPHGTLAAHRQHSAHTDFYANLAQQDLTAHVNFTPLLETAQAAGLRVEFFGAQGKFLLENGLPDLLQARIDATKDEFERLRLSTRAKQLFHPDALGDAFRVLHARTP